jgi:hypothetical protein
MQWRAAAVFVIGGGTLGGSVLNTVEKYEVNNGGWNLMDQRMTTPRVNAAAAVYQGI